MKTQTWEEYLHYFDQILSGEFINELYEKEDYRNYVKMNHTRVHRWLKHAELDGKLIDLIKSIDSKQLWYLITEPWCGDAAHSTPIIARLAKLNEHIDLRIVLREENPDFMDRYLTNGGRSIPKLIVRDSEESDLFNWGPRPVELAAIHLELRQRQAAFDEINKTLQTWYNNDKGYKIQQELTAHFENVISASQKA